MKTLRSIFLSTFLTVASFGALAGKININEADVAALTDLNGIGHARAEAIVAYRKAHGPFRTIEDLTNVKGIGPAFVDKNREQITVGESARPDQKATAD
jgi:competence protein ComEA